MNSQVIHDPNASQEPYEHREYPKHVVKDGKTVLVNSAEEESALTPKPEDPAPGGE